MTDVIVGPARRSRPGGDGGVARTGDPVEGPRPHGVGIVHEPALDGLRGLAVAAVVVFHLDHLRGGFLGVDLFFVLSGFLITSLLVVEHSRRRAIDLGRFWARRARRLLPALFLTIVGVSLVLLRIAEGPHRARYRDDALATLGYVANWHRMTSELGYWDMFSTPSPFDHMWSLAIEEQFYVVWPVVALLVLGTGRRAARRQTPAAAADEIGVGAEAEAETDAGAEADAGGGLGFDDRRRRERRLAIVAAGGAVVSLVLLWITWSPIDTNRAYFSTDTRIGPTLLGATLAVMTAHRARRQSPPSWRIELLALVALAWMTWSVVFVDGFGSWYYRGGLATFAVATVVVIHAVTGGPPGPLGRAISWRPLCLLGTISYGVYLWHWPVIVVIDESRSGLDGLALDALQVAVTLALSVASFVLLERPVRRGGWSAAQLRRLLVGGVAVTLVVVLAAMWGTPAPSRAVTISRIPLGGSTNPYLLYPEPGAFPPSATRVLLVGDSGVEHMGPELVARGEELGVSVATSAQVLCTVTSPEGITQTSTGVVNRNDLCHDDRIRLWTEMIDVYDPDIVIYYLANAGQLGTQRFEDEWVSDCDAGYDAYLRGALRGDLELLGAGGAGVFMTTSPQPAVLNETSHERVGCRTETYEQAVDAVPGAQLLDLKTFVQDTVNRPDADFDFFQDVLHFSDAGGRAASEWLLPQTGAVDPSLTVDPVDAAEHSPP